MCVLISMDVAYVIEYCFTSVMFNQVWSALGAMCKALDMKPREDHTADYYSTRNQETTTNPTSTNQQSQVHGVTRCYVV